VRKRCLLPLIQLKLQILSLLLSNKDVAKLPREFSDNRLSDRQQEFSDIFLPDQKQLFSDIRSKIASNQNDA
jgi:hypothetical protein